MMHFRSLVLFLFFLACGAHLSIRIDDSRKAVQQEDNRVGVSGDAREVLIPGGFGTRIFGRASPQADAVREGYRQDGRRAGHFERHRRAPFFRLDPHRAKVALQAARVPEEDQLPPQEVSEETRDAAKKALWDWYTMTASKRASELASEQMNEATDPEEKEKNPLEQIKKFGVAGVVSYALWEGGFWTIGGIGGLLAYYLAFGQWPDLANQEDAAKVGAEAFAFINLARFAVPLRIGLAVGTAPWVEENVIKRFGLSKTGEEADWDTHAHTHADTDADC